MDYPPWLVQISEPETEWEIDPDPDMPERCIHCKHIKSNKIAHDVIYYSLQWIRFLYDHLTGTTLRKGKQNACFTRVSSRR